MADTLFNKRRILSYLCQKWKRKIGYCVKSGKIFANKCAKMTWLTFGVGIIRRKIDEYRTEDVNYHNGYYAGADRRGRADRCPALTHPKGRDASPSLRLLSIQQKYFADLFPSVFL
ncbi:hypothetical protein MXL54_11230 [Enterobacteriaceae bacterium G50]|nr:hypothetical protein [Enterobacteriaceae bacterium G50]